MEYEVLKTKRDLTGETLKDFIEAIDDSGNIGVLYIHDSKDNVCHPIERNDYPDYWLLDRLVLSYEIRRKKRRKSIVVDVYI